MGKGNKSVDNGYEYPSDTDVSFPDAKEKKYKGTKSETVTLIFKENRKKELHIGRSVYTFYGPGSKLEVPRHVIEHPDFESQRNDFTIKEE